MIMPVFRNTGTDSHRIITQLVRDGIKIGVPMYMFGFQSSCPIVPF